MGIKSKYYTPILFFLIVPFMQQHQPQIQSAVQNGTDNVWSIASKKQIERLPAIGNTNGICRFNAQQ